jgi:tRNA(Ile)-lysidine synthase
MLHKGKNFNEIMENAKKISGKWGVAISGGADSLGLFFAIRDFLFEMNWNVELNLLIVNHNLRTESAKEVEFVEDLANNYNYKLYKVEWNHGGFFEKNLYDNARKARYKLIIDECKANEIGVFFTAHHFDDQIETFKMRIARGAGVSGLSCINSHLICDGVSIFRPFLEVKRKDIKSYLSKNNIIWIEDRANYNINYERARMRRVEGVSGCIGENSLGNLSLVVKKMFLANDALNFYTDLEFARVVSVNYTDMVKIIVVNRSGFFEIPVKIATRILKKILIMHFFVEPRRVIFCELINIYEKMKNNLFIESGYLQFSNFMIQCNKDCFLFKKQ